MASTGDVKAGKHDILRDRWPQLKNKVKEQWEQLTDDDLAAFSGDQEELVSLLQLRYGYTMEQAEQEVDTWLRNREKELHTAQTAS